MEEKERFAWLTFDPHTVALCSLIASSRAPAHPCIHTHTVTHFFPLPPPPQPPRPQSLLVQHGSALKRTHGRTDIPKAPWTHQNWSGWEGGREEDKNWMWICERVCTFKDWFICLNFYEVQVHESFCTADTHCKNKKKIFHRQSVCWMFLE